MVYCYSIITVMLFGSHISVNENPHHSEWNIFFQILLKQSDPSAQEKEFIKMYTQVLNLGMDGTKNHEEVLLRIKQSCEVFEPCSADPSDAFMAKCRFACERYIFDRYELLTAKYGSVNENPYYSEWDIFFKILLKQSDLFEQEIEYIKRYTQVLNLEIDGVKSFEKVLPRIKQSCEALESNYPPNPAADRFRSPCKTYIIDRYDRLTAKYGSVNENPYNFFEVLLKEGNLSAEEIQYINNYTEALKQEMGGAGNYEEGLLKIKQTCEALIPIPGSADSEDEIKGVIGRIKQYCKTYVNDRYALLMNNSGSYAAKNNAYLLIGFLIMCVFCKWQNIFKICAT